MLPNRGFRPFRETGAGGRRVGGGGWGGAAGCGRVRSLGSLLGDLGTNPCAVGGGKAESLFRVTLGGRREIPIDAGDQNVFLASSKAEKTIACDRNFQFSKSRKPQVRLGFTPPHVNKHSFRVFAGRTGAVLPRPAESSSSGAPRKRCSREAFARRTRLEQTE